MLIISHLIEHKDDFKFEGSNEWILSWAVGYGTELLNFGTPEEKSENAKLFFDTVGEFLKIEDLKISKNQMREIDKIRSKII